MRYIKDIRENERLIEHYLVKRKEARESKAGKHFLSLKLADKTGSLDGKIWDMTSHIAPFDEGEMVKVDGTVTLFNGEFQLKITKLRRSMEGEYAPADYVPTTDKDIDEMFARLTALVKSVENAHLNALLENILLKDEGRTEMLKTHSAAKGMHHAFLGGLLEHTLSVAEICDTLAARYKYVDRDVLLTGALLHDIGKIYELSPMPVNEYTDDGQLLGHIIMGVELVTAQAAKIEGFPHELLSLVKHMLLSHHGELEFGSPKLPLTPEAMLLHFADNIDAKLTAFDEIISKDGTPGKYTSFSKPLGRLVRKP
jgi:3'-5' exoribonuclease